MSDRFGQKEKIGGGNVWFFLCVCFIVLTFSCRARKQLEDAEEEERCTVKTENKSCI